MSNYLKRIGTLSFKFVVEIELSSIELSGISTPGRVIVVFKRSNLILTPKSTMMALDDYKVTSKNAPLLENGIAYFNETLLMPVTLHFDKKKNIFLEKEVKFIDSTLHVYNLGRSHW